MNSSFKDIIFYSMVIFWKISPVCQIKREFVCIVCTNKAGHYQKKSFEHKKIILRNLVAKQII